MEQVFEIDKYSIFTKVEGEGFPLLLLHSYWGSQSLFDHLSLELSAKMRVIRIDLPGHGYSNAPPEDFTFDKFAPILNELLFRLNIRGKISVVGHSMGGYAALAFAAKYPERISSLVLMHSQVKSADAKSIKLREREGRLLLRGKKDLLLQVTIPSNFAPGNTCKMTKEVALLNETSSRVTLEGALGAIFAIIHRENSLAILQIARYPILIIIGKYDKVYRPDEQLDEANQIPNAEVLVLSHSGHLGFLEEEDLVIKKLQGFLKSSLAYRKI
jgi:pimeloyl-ACP methyl ester carboxylesterase